MIAYNIAQISDEMATVSWEKAKNTYESPILSKRKGKKKIG